MVVEAEGGVVPYGLAEQYVVVKLRKFGCKFAEGSASGGLGNFVCAMMLKLNAISIMSGINVFMFMLRT
mgnify:CR=1 FL=1